MSSICRYIQLGVYIRGYTDKATHNFKREIAEVTEFYVTNDTNEAGHNVIYRKGADGKVIRNNPSPYLIDYLEVQGVFLPKELRNMAGDTYTDGDSLKSNAEKNASLNNDSNVIVGDVKPNTAPTVNTGMLNEVNQGNFEVKEIVNSSNMNNSSVNSNVINSSNMNNFSVNSNLNSGMFNNVQPTSNVNLQTSETGKSVENLFE